MSRAAVEGCPLARSMLFSSETCRNCFTCRAAFWNKITFSFPCGCEHPGPSCVNPLSVVRCVETVKQPNQEGDIKIQKSDYEVSVCVLVNSTMCVFDLCIHTLEETCFKVEKSVLQSVGRS